MGQRKSRLPVVVLLRNHAIETNRAAAEVRKTGIPYLNSVALAAILRLDNVKTKEAKGITVFND